MDWMNPLNEVLQQYTNAVGHQPAPMDSGAHAKTKTQDVMIERQENLTWCCVPVIIDNDTANLFEMSKPDDNPEQKPVFVVTQSTANLVQQDFERYRPSLERMVEDWREAKNSLSAGKHVLNPELWKMFRV